MSDFYCMPNCMPFTFDLVEINDNLAEVRPEKELI